MAPVLPRHVVLIGMRGSGKTAVGRELAAALRVTFSDLDERALASLHRPSVRDVWSRYGERTWRQAEAHVLAQAIAEPPHVISSGGGVPMIDDARGLLANERRAGRAWCVHLLARLDVLAERVRAAEGRPSLTGFDPADELAAVLEVRLPVYESLADLTVDTSDGAPPAAARTIIDGLGLLRD